MKQRWKDTSIITSPRCKVSYDQNELSPQGEEGFTLIELLAGLALSSLVIILITSVLVSGIHLFNNIGTEAILRDEADAMMSTIIERLYNYHPDELMDGAFNLPGEIQFRVKNLDDGRGIQLYYVMRTDPDQRLFPQDILLQDGVVRIGEETVSHPTVNVMGTIRLLETDDIEAEAYGYREGTIEVDLTLTHQEDGKTLDVKSSFGF